MKDIFFLHGLPRAGNTLFSSIMNQNPDVAVTANSICADMMGELFMLKHTDIFKNYPDHKSFDNVAKSVFENYYRDWKQDYIIDRAPWGFPINLKFLKETRSNVKIILLVRDVIEVLGSFIKWSEKEPTSFVNRYAAKTVEEKCDMLMNKEGVIVKEKDIQVENSGGTRIYRVFVLVEFDENAAQAKLLAQIKADQQLYDAIKASELIDEMEQKVEAYRQRK